MKCSVFTLRGRNRLLKTLHNVRVTLLCGLLTFIVLRSSLGAGKFGTPVQDYDEIRHRLHRFKLRAHQQKLFLSRELTDAALRKETSRSTLSLSTDDGHVDIAERSHAFDNRGSFLQQFEQRLPRRPPILLVTTRSHPCNSAIAAKFFPKFLKNKIDYCRLHGIEVFLYDVELVTGTSGKVHVLQKLMLSHPKTEWIWWMDSFTLFTDMLSLPMLERYAGYNVVQHGNRGAVSGKDEVLNTWEKLWPGGSFMLRNSELSRSYLENEGRMQGAAKVFLDVRMEMYEQGVRNSEAWQPLVMNFGSCNLCGKDNTDISCLTEMEGALNVANSVKAQVVSL